MRNDYLPEVDPAKLARLPQWARKHIEHLDTALAERTAEALDARHGLSRRLAAGPDSDTIADPYTSDPVPLGTGVTIRFRVDHGEVTVRTMERTGGRKVLDVMGSGGVMILPRSSNTFELEIGR
jgi:hypothetical protein